MILKSFVAHVYVCFHMKLVLDVHFYVLLFTIFFAVHVFDVHFFLIFHVQMLYLLI